MGRQQVERARRYCRRTGGKRGGVSRRGSIWCKRYLRASAAGLKKQTVKRRQCCPLVGELKAAHAYEPILPSSGRAQTCKGLKNLQEPSEDKLGCSPELEGPCRAAATLWVPFCVMALTGSWCCPTGAMVTVCRGAADWLLWMTRLDDPIEVMVGTVSTLTEEEEETKEG